MYNSVCVLHLNVLPSNFDIIWRILDFYFHDTIKVAFLSYIFTDQDKGGRGRKAQIGAFGLDSLPEGKQVFAFSHWTHILTTETSLFQIWHYNLTLAYIKKENALKYLRRRDLDNERFNVVVFSFFFNQNKTEKNIYYTFAVKGFQSNIIGRSSCWY